jgi:transposase
MVEQKVKGHVYLYRVESYWDKEKKQSRQRRTYIGKKDPESGQVVLEDEIRDAREFGTVYLLDQLAKQLGVTEDLASVFPELWREILAVAWFRICENRALYLCEHWLETVWTEEPVSLSSPRISELLGQVGHSNVSAERFFRHWVQRFVDTNRFIIFDITSISSYANGIDEVEWGYNRDREVLPQVNIGMIYGEPSGLPLCYSLYPGSIHDVTTLKNMVKELDVLSLKKTVFVLDKGFYSKHNLQHMHGMKFVIPLPLRCSAEAELIASAQEIIRSAEYAIHYRDHLYYCISKPLTIGELRYTAHIYLDERKQVDQRELFLRKLMEAEELVAAQDFTSREQILGYINDQLSPLAQYFTVRRKETRAVLVRNSRKIDAFVGRMGMFVLITSTGLSPAQIIAWYRQKDGVEKCFDALKNDLFLKRLRIHSRAAMEGLLFIEFVAMILRAKLSAVLRDMKALKDRESMCVPEMLAELRKLKQLTFGKKKALSEISKTQRKIFASFGIPLDTAT